MNTHVIPDAYHYWRAAIAARKPVDAPKGIIAAGYYRARDGEAVAFTTDGDELSCWRSGDFPVPSHADALLDLFARVSPYPVEFEAFSHFCTEGRWPDQVAPVEVAANLPPHEAADAEVSAQREALAAWIKEIGKVTTQEHATKAGNFADAFAKLEKASDEKRKSEKEPHLEAGRAVDAKWQPIVKRAGELKAYAKKTTEPFLIAEKARLAAEEKAAAEARAKAAREAEEARRQAEATGAPPPVVEPPPLPAPQPAKAKAGKVHLRSVTKHEIVDLRTVLEFLAKMNQPPAELRDVAQVIVNRMRNAGVEIPGVETKTVEVAS